MMPIITQVSPKNSFDLPSSSAARSTPSQPVIQKQNQGGAIQGIEPNLSELKYAVSKLNEYVQNSRRDLHFSLDKDSGRVVVKVVDSETREVIRQIPSEEVIALAQGLGLKESAGALFDTQV